MKIGDIVDLDNALYELIEIRDDYGLIQSGSHKKSVKLSRIKDKVLGEEEIKFLSPDLFSGNIKQRLYSIEYEKYANKS